MSRELRILIAAFGDPGHTFPGIALGRALGERGHRVVFETWEKWRDVLGEAGIEFHAAEEYRVFAPSKGDGPSAGDAAVALAPLLEELRPDVVVNDILTLAPALAAEKAGVPWATLIPHVYPEHEAGLPFFAFGGARLPRTPLGRWLWTAPLPLLEAGLRQGRDEMNGEREKAGLPPLERFHGGTSEALALVATLPAARVSARLASARACDGADGVRDAVRGRGVARGGWAAGAGGAVYCAGSGVPAGAGCAGGACRRAGARPCDDERSLSRARESKCRRMRGSMGG